MSQFSENPSVQECLRESARCIGCGTCLTSCPVYAQEPREELTARGRNRHILELLDGHDNAAETVGKCLLCGRCTMVCPRGIRNDLIVAGLRGLMVQRDGLPFAKNVAFRKLLSNRRLMARALRFAAAAQRLLPSESGVGIGNLCDPPCPTVRHLPLFFSTLGKGRRLPAVASSFLSERLPENVPASGPVSQKLRVAYFAGCATEFVLPRTGEAVVRVLAEAGMDVVFPHAQGCCGLAAHANGDVETATAMARHNLEVLEAANADLIVTSCATCGTALRDIWPRLAQTEEERQRFLSLAAKTRDASELILSAASPGAFSCRSNLPRGATVTWHEPCHLGRHQHVSREPLTILRRTFGESFHPLRETGCCGFGGSFNLYHYEMSQKIGVRKADNIREAGADYVVTSCPGCLMQIADLMARHGVPGRVIHLAEAISFRA
ncbi:MAG TPA: (Fe-S)-binding protein [Candidatus Avidesulfovibrio excrementigallinarum]|nr:(Fe-S)-binding protein [Candidatus Avidesulfovibrio excrementigallinarum]